MTERASLAPSSDLAHTHRGEVATVIEFKMPDVEFPSDFVPMATSGLLDSKPSLPVRDLVVISGPVGTGKSSILELLRRKFLLEHEVSQLLPVTSITRWIGKDWDVPKRRQSSLSVELYDMRGHASRLPACSMLSKKKTHVIEAFTSETGRYGGDNPRVLSESDTPLTSSYFLAGFTLIAGYSPEDVVDPIAYPTEQSRRRLCYLQRRLSEIRLALRSFFLSVRPLEVRAGTPFSRALVQFCSALVGTQTRTAPPVAA